MHNLCREAVRRGWEDVAGVENVMEKWKIRLKMSSLWVRGVSRAPPAAALFVVEVRWAIRVLRGLSAWEVVEMRHDSRLRRGLVRLVGLVEVRLR